MRLREASGILGILVVMIGFLKASTVDLLAGAETSQAQSDNTSENKKARKVYTNQDLVDLRSKQERKQAGGTLSQDSKQSKSGKTQATKTTRDLSLNSYRDLEGHDRSYWQGKIKPLRRELESLDSQIQTLQEQRTQAGPAAGIKVTKSGRLQTQSNSRENLDRRIETLSQKRSQVEKSMRDLEEDARKAQALPEWLR